MHERPAFDCTRGQYVLDFRGFSPGCTLLGALLPPRASSRSPDRTPAGHGLGRARVVSSGLAQSSKRSPYTQCLLNFFFRGIYLLLCSPFVYLYIYFIIFVCLLFTSVCFTFSSFTFLCFYDTSFFSWCVYAVPVITQQNGMALRCLPGAT